MTRLEADGDKAPMLAYPSVLHACFPIVAHKLGLFLWCTQACLSTLECLSPFVAFHSPKVRFD